MFIVSTENFAEFIEIIYEATVHEKIWPLVLLFIARVIKASTVRIFEINLLDGKCQFLLEHQEDSTIVDSEQKSMYHRILSSLLLSSQNNVSLGAPQQINLSSNNEMGWSGLQDTHNNYYQIWSSWIHLGMVVEKNSHSALLLIANKPMGEEGFSQLSMSFLKQISLHLSRALALKKREQSFEKQLAVLCRAVDVIKKGVFFLDGNAQLFYANDYAKNMVSKSSLVVVRSGKLSLTDAIQNKKLQHLILESLTETNQQTKYLEITVNNNSAETVYWKVSVQSLNTVTDSDNDRAKVLMVLIEPMYRKYELSRELLKSSFGLAAHEMSVCQDFVDLIDLDKVAQKNNWTLKTVRTYLKKIYEKTGVHSQAELMRFLLDLRRL